MLLTLVPKSFAKFLNLFVQDEPQTTLAGLLTTSGYSNDITKNGNSGDGKSSRESRGKICLDSFRTWQYFISKLSGRSVGGGPIRPRSRNIDTSPYSSNNTAYLSPPESSWRRTSSDSAIHQSLAQQAHVRKAAGKCLRYFTKHIFRTFTMLYTIHWC